MKIDKFFLCLFATTIFSCGEDFFEQVVIVDIPEHIPALAVSANLSDVDTILVVYVSNSVGILEPDQPVIIENAAVQFYKNDQLLYDLAYNANGLYGITGISPIGTEPAEYMLKVQAPGYDPVNSTQIMPQPVPITEAAFEREGTVTPDGDRVNEISITFLDPSGIENYYSISALARVTEGSSEYQSTIYLQSFNPIIEEGDDFLVFNDATFDGKEITLSFYTYDDYNDSAESVELDIDLISISKDRYFFEKSLNIFYNSNGNPFAEPVVVHNNIESGYGIFTLESRSKFTVKIL